MNKDEAVDVGVKIFLRILSICLAIILAIWAFIDFGLILRN